MCFLQFPPELKIAIGERGYPASLTGLMSDDEYARVQASRRKETGRGVIATEGFSAITEDLSDISAEGFRPGNELPTGYLHSGYRQKNQY